MLESDKTTPCARNSAGLLEKHIKVGGFSQHVRRGSVCSSCCELNLSNDADLAGSPVTGNAKLLGVYYFLQLIHLINSTRKCNRCMIERIKGCFESQGFAAYGKSEIFQMRRLSTRIAVPVPAPIKKLPWVNVSSVVVATKVPSIKYASLLPITIAIMLCQVPT